MIRAISLADEPRGSVAVDIPFSIRLVATKTFDQHPHSSQSSQLTTTSLNCLPSIQFSPFTEIYVGIGNFLYPEFEQNTSAHTEKANQKLLLKPTNPFRTASASQREIYIALG